MFLKQKRSGQLKSIGCADGLHQRIYSQKRKASSPTMMIESVMLNSVIDAFEGRDAATVDILEPSYRLTWTKQCSGLAPLGKGATSLKQKLITRSSTVSELVAVYDDMP
jgi:hypothetical protein